MAAASEPGPRATPRRKGLGALWFVLAASALALPAVAGAGFLLGQRSETAREATLPVIGAAPSYTLTNQLGEQISSSRFLGKVRLVTFLFPYCTTLCPLIAAHLTNLEDQGLRPAGLADKVAIVSFNVDPEDTGPRQMREFLQQYGWDPQDLHWQYLVGSPAEVHRVVTGGFSVWYKRVSLASKAQQPSVLPMIQPDVENKLADSAHVDYDIVHNDVLEIVDQQGRIRKIYDDADTVDWQTLLLQVEALVQQKG